VNSENPDRNRRDLLVSMGAVAAGAVLAKGSSALAAAPAGPSPASPPSLVPAPRDWVTGGPFGYPDPDIVALDPRFRRYVIFNTPLQRLHTGTLWAEGPAWNGTGRYLVWSDIPSDQQLRWLDDDGHISTLRRPSGNSNGNTFDARGRQLAAEHGNRRVIRYEATGEVTVVADHYQGKRLNSPNDVVVHPDGSIWFTDPSFGIRGSYEGNPGTSETKEALYRVDPQNGRIDKMSDEMGQPNGLCFSPDYSRLYVADTGAGEIRVWDVDGAKLKQPRTFARIALPDGSRSAADGIRCDADGNIWAGARPGVVVLSPEGATIGFIRLPEICANVCFGGVKRNRLFMTASQSLYAVYVGARGAHWC
jgi:gluconolactonase